MASIEFTWRDRNIGPSQTPRHFLDFLIDGRSLYEELGDLISPLGWGALSEQQKAVDRFLLVAPADLPNNRRSIYVCPECGDLGCGAVSAVVERVGDKVVWRDFADENDYDEEMFSPRDHIGPFEFDADEYFRFSKLR
jgi:hypothetical protein